MSIIERLDALHAAATVNKTSAYYDRDCFREELTRHWPAISAVLKAACDLEEGDFDDFGPRSTPLYDALHALAAIEPKAEEPT